MDASNKDRAPQGTQQGDGKEGRQMVAVVVALGALTTCTASRGQSRAGGGRGGGVNLYAVEGGGGLDKARQGRTRQGRIRQGQGEAKQDKAS